MGLTTKKRDLPDPPGNYDFSSELYDNIGKFWYGGTHIKDAELPWPTGLKGKQVTASENHPTWRKRSRDRFGGDIGGPFRTEKLSIEGNPGQVNLGGERYNPDGSPQSRATYRGICWAINPSDPLVTKPVAPESSDTLLKSLGTSAIADVKPTNSIADLATLVGELYREGVPRAIGASKWHSGTDAARKTSGDFLGIEFGFKPIVSDIFDFAQAVVDADAVMTQYERDAGRIVRRGKEFPTETGGSTSIVKTGARPFTAVSHTALTSGIPASGQVTKTEIWFRRRWFEGAFTYYLPSDYRSRKEMGRLATMASVLLGTDLSPEVLWNLAPWTWAIDWVSNTGDVLSNLSDWLNDGLVLRYGYIMEHSFRKYIYSYSAPSKYFKGTEVAAPLIISHEVKKRVQSTPFGFGATWESFTARQIAILTALGITRSK